MCRYRRASSRRASRGSTSGRGTVQMVGCLAPSHRIRIVPVGAAYLRRLALCSPRALPASPGGGLDPPTPRRDREERGAGLAARRPRPRPPPERAPSAWEPLVERADLTPECKDLCPGEAERGHWHVRPPHSWYLGRP